MSDITYEWKIEQIRNAKNKSHWRVRAFKNEVESHISGLRLTANKKELRGTVIAKYCGKEATRLEKALTFAMFGIEGKEYEH